MGIRTAWLGTMKQSTYPARLLAVVGPTASGKSPLGMKVARRLGGEIVNCDSMQLIRGMEVGTAKPTPEERAAVPHHLYDRIEPDEWYSAGKYMHEARAVCREIAGRGRMPIIVGGTGLYLRALLEGVFEGPGRSPRFRRRVQRIARVRGPEHLHRLLKRRDPAAAARIQAADEVRLIRALEVHFLTGRPISRMQRARRPLEGFMIRKIGLRPARPDLYGRINARVNRMFEAGLLEEVRTLLDQGYSPDCKGFEAIGYRQAVAVVQGRMTIPQAVAVAAQRSRHYAKRQLTWFRKEPDLQWIDFPGESPRAYAQLVERLGEEFLAGLMKTGAGGDGQP